VSDGKAVNKNGESGEAILAALHEKAMALPRSPGVYIMEGEDGKVIYVGKSRSLRDRVEQYFHGSHDVKTARMASSVRSFRFITTETEMEALSLENNLIKQHKPKYNILLKDSKSYPYVRISNEPYPRITVTRQRRQDRASYFGPYSGTGVIYPVIRTLEKSLGLVSCKRQFPRDIGRERPCMYYQTGKCVGVCTGNVTEEEYRELVKMAADVLGGKRAAVVDKLTKRMEEYAENERYEAAARCRDAIKAIGSLGEGKRRTGDVDAEYDVIGYFSGELGACAAVYYVRDGYVSDSEYFEFGEYALTEQSEGDYSPLAAFIASLYRGREYIPREIVLSFSLDESECRLLGEYLGERAGHRVTVRTPERGEVRRMARSCEDDAKRHLETRRSAEDRDERLLVRLAQMLRLEVVPERIEAYDISNLGSEHITAGMIAAIHGRLRRSEYRYFRIRDLEAPDDYESMRQTIERRMAHLSDKEGSFSDLPDLLLIDGGEGHVNAVCETLERIGVDVAAFGMVKDAHHKTRTLVSRDGSEINIAKDKEIFTFIYKLQEEVHRFTVSRMTRAKRKTLKTSTLEAIPGIGAAKAKALFASFGTLDAIKRAGTDELAAVKGISKKDAESIVKHFAEK
jgi:excinuclease ABC subunit C